MKKSDEITKFNFGNLTYFWIGIYKGSIKSNEPLNIDSAILITCYNLCKFCNIK